jgi:hypothetical protein
MLSKVYIALLAIFTAIMVFFTYYSWSWLDSIGSPTAAIAGYEFHSSSSWTVLWLSAAGLLLLANSILWVTGRIWSMWATFTYFSLFVVIKAFWLDPASLFFMASAGMTDQTFTVGPIMATILIIVAASIVFFDQFLLIRLREKTFPTVVDDDTKSEIEPTESN